MLVSYLEGWCWYSMNITSPGTLLPSCDLLTGHNTTLHNNSHCTPSFHAPLKCFPLTKHTISTKWGPITYTETKTKLSLSLSWSIRKAKPIYKRDSHRNVNAWSTRSFVYHANKESFDVKPDLNWTSDERRMQYWAVCAKLSWFAYFSIF